MRTRFWLMVGRSHLSQARRFSANWMWAALETSSYRIHAALYGGPRYTLCAKSYDLQHRPFWSVFRRVADYCHPEHDHCRKSAERHRCLTESR